ncbi:hypothetical protein PV773_11000 [Mesorhizobium sp. CC13]|uniref:hypothetical protein n=1 Tax=Mesorhizobium sp. CC13 TaxID=3029194 RepID=UPI0032678B6A
MSRATASSSDRVRSGSGKGGPTCANAAPEASPISAAASTPRHGLRHAFRGNFRAIR